MLFLYWVRTLPTSSIKDPTPKFRTLVLATEIEITLELRYNEILWDVVVQGMSFSLLQ